MFERKQEPNKEKDDQEIRRAEKEEKGQNMTKITMRKEKREDMTRKN